MSDDSTTPPNIETRMIFVQCGSGLIDTFTQKLQDWLNEGFSIVKEETNGGYLYIRLERDNVKREQDRRFLSAFYGEK